MDSTYTFSELCAALGKTAIYIHNIQKVFSLPVLKANEKYSEGHRLFLENIISLRTLSVSMEDIVKLLVLEKTILHLIQIDSLNDEPTWYLDHCANRYSRRTKSFVLMLTDYELDDASSVRSMQRSLDLQGRRKASCSIVVRWARISTARLISIGIGKEDMGHCGQGGCRY